MPIKILQEYTNYDGTPHIRSGPQTSKGSKSGVRAPPKVPQIGKIRGGVLSGV